MAQSNDGFRWQQAAWGDVLTCEPLERVARHLFTTRALEIGASTEDLVRGHRAVSEALGISPGRLFHARQVHRADVFAIDSHTAPDERPEADILIASTPGTGLVVRVADCVPLLIADRRSAAVAAVHAGWRGTVARAGPTAVDALTRMFGSEPLDLVAAIGPSIGRCCYQVGPDVKSAFADRYPQAHLAWFATDGERWRLDLQAANRDQLIEAGVSPENVHVAAECTASSADRYYSYRREGPRAGRLLAAIRSGQR